MLLGQDTFLAVLGAILVWLAGFSFLFWRYTQHYRKLTIGVDKKELGEILEKVLADLGSEKKRTDRLFKNLEEISEKDKFHIQKVGLVRFNPFSETGGNQSFSLALLDGQDSGFILSTLHSRDQTRIYAKPIKNGKGKGFDLSKEEREAIEKAKND